MQTAFGDTIFAVASGLGRTALTIVRVSGPEAGRYVTALCGRLPPPRRATLSALRNSDGEVLDRALALWFPGPGSYTGEDSCELHLHGGSAVLEGVARALTALGARPAEPGEFTRRAVTYGRMDLLEAEAVADLIDAETALQRQQALQQLGGALSAVYVGWAARLLRLLAQQEALIDFPDEDLPPEVQAGLVSEIAALRDAFVAHLAEGSRGERLRTGLVFAIAGAPNVGKSTLINALCQRDVAIVSPQAGTTRDVLEARVVIEGVPVTLLDTAGLRDSDDPVEVEGIRRARERMRQASLVIGLQESGRPEPAGLLYPGLPVLVVRTKADLVGLSVEDGLAISAQTGEGMDRLWAALAETTRRLAGVAASPMLTRERHRAALTRAAENLTASLETPLPELRGEELRLAVLALGRITGAVGIEDVLDSIFGQFCIGK